MNEFSFREMKTWGQSKVSSCCFFVWSESRELGGRGSSRFPCVIPVVETSSDRVTFRILSNINDGAPNSLRKQPTLTVDCFRKKAPPQTSDQIPNADLARGTVDLACGWTTSA